ncbi:LysR family transcriptional regulator [Pseudocitrobacter sp. 2023EL-00150]|uniref:LysR family transcriptional regulator n=1 Tax=Pseudocitrobacter sp. 2023EL-00150 TaxID=3032322 RepID=UPI0023E4148C|nr:LysR family transcriptional regulator [Pseudocitrobacter sp. 2023EL-00150]MDF3828007.1 LysR family transcriptional regulator [Pseudocitrobacter sp. 2023EL-00150]
MKFTLRQLEFYIALAETLQVSKAASRCHVSQSSMTVALRNLEEALNAQLFLRQPKGIRLTLAGERFLTHARTIISNSHIALEDLHRQPETTAGKVRIGIAQTLSAYLLPEMLSDIENRFPLLEIDYFETTAPELRQQQVDFCLLLTSNIERDSNLVVETILRSLRQLWIAPGHALLSQSVIRLRDIEKLPFLMLETDQYPTVITQVWQHAGYQPSIHFRSNSFEAVRSLVAQGNGITILSDLVYRPWSLNGQRVIRRTIEDCITYMDVGVVTNAGQQLSVPAQRLRDFLRTLIVRLEGKS